MLGKENRRQTIIVIIVPVLVSLVLLVLGSSCFLFRKERKKESA